MATIVDNAELGGEITEARRKQVLGYAQALGIVHYVVAGLMAFTGLAFTIHIAVGLAALSGLMPFEPLPDPAAPDPSIFFGSVFLGAGVVALLVFEGIAALLAYAGYCFISLKNRTFLLIMSGVNCLNQPIGLLLGIFGFLFLLNRDVAEMFEEKRDEELA